MKVPKTVSSKDIWLAVYGAAYVQAAEGKSLDREDVATRCHVTAVVAANKAMDVWAKSAP